MARYLTQEWTQLVLQETRDLPERRGANARLQYVLTGDNDVHYYWTLEHGRVTEVALGTLDKPDYTITMTYDDSVRIERGELTEEAAFAQGTMKFTGSMVRAMTLMPVMDAPEFKAAMARIRAATEL
ncbi:SCP2 sterol-binding domain-containing protein [Nonomuraea endophytica]|uniref:Putative sterol carrier protein n=1 Tax=Nonomuraea endophytica TaxID=714136 RepID=A0A7W8A4R1_9ACTN|nr:SCP2 sterol-binding domain-containing protein [Nonomuraea endophytica]MBB5079469.1 putative sterol carrier protein [Nonomuraea endophytica]